MKKLVLMFVAIAAISSHLVVTKQLRLRVLTQQIQLLLTLFLLLIQLLLTQLLLTQLNNLATTVKRRLKTAGHSLAVFDFI